MTVYGISGGPMPQFREGWAILPFFGSRGCIPHYWTRRGLEKVYDSLCGHTHQLFHRGVRPLEPGVFMVDRCKNCKRKHERAALQHNAGHSDSANDQHKVRE